MSGGSMDYLYRRVQDATFRSSSVERRAFRAHLLRVAKALRAIEWNDSGDGADDESDAIRACLRASDCLEQAIRDAKDAEAALALEICRALELQNGGFSQPSKETA